jgi:DNA-binding PadR family transcriptional regulator
MYTQDMGIENELKKGSIQTLILAVLATKPLHGYGIAREIEKRSADILSFNEGRFILRCVRLNVRN